ncbi:BC1881 family protein [Priestia taiwanensis]|uniref:BC1881 family protein n=1 Tax=Priestia taiwanensis TaxID=1347902 RepID=A0A917ESB0_9BACI|nr:BC1881 family protein [Priestia taiwanensis]MBM7364806.1 hypothetical protein [Priestia taiwanensis]GGE79831.1 hypothetical protein GCM10007140_31720 [Priestia taiwanensis]
MDKKDELVEQLKLQVNVTSVDVPTFETKSVGNLSVDGPATILIIK